MHVLLHLPARLIAMLHFREAMLALLRSGTTLVVDRYSLSGVVFTSAKHLPGLDLAWCKVLCLPVFAHPVRKQPFVCSV